MPTTSDRMAIVESFASFRDRAIQFGIDEADVAILKDKKFASFGAFTFIAIYNPNSADDATLKAALAHVLGRDITIEDMARFRRLHFESSAITISSRYWSSSRYWINGKAKGADGTSSTNGI